MARPSYSLQFRRVLRLFHPPRRFWPLPFLAHPDRRGGPKLTWPRLHGARRGAAGSRCGTLAPRRGTLDARRGRHGHPARLHSGARAGGHRWPSGGRRDANNARSFHNMRPGGRARPPRFYPALRRAGRRRRDHAGPPGMRPTHGARRGGRGTADEEEAAEACKAGKRQPGRARREAPGHGRRPRRAQSARRHCEQNGRSPRPRTGLSRRKG